MDIDVNTSASGPDDPDHDTSSSISTTSSAEFEAAAARSRRRRTMMLTVLAITTEAMELASRMYEKQAYHTSVLSGHAWVLELLNGHPDRIRCELGVSHDVFDLLLSDLRGMGYKDSRHVTLEEQLAIFLYTCVTGLSTRHVGERFQRANNTIAKYASNHRLFQLKLTFLLADTSRLCSWYSLHPHSTIPKSNYQVYWILFLQPYETIPPDIPFSRMPLGQLMGLISIAPLQHRNAKLHVTEWDS
jgi:hypothetical protein